VATGKVVDAKAEHVWHIAAHMREADRMEVEATGKDNPFDAVNLSYKMSRKAWTAIVDDEPIMMFGVSPISELSGLGSPWLLGTDGVLKVKRQFIRECRGCLEDMISLYPRLINSVDVRNEVSIRWLHWLGFEFYEPISIGANGELFYPFYMEKK
jgi:hypothetical protein